MQTPGAHERVTPAARWSSLFHDHLWLPLALGTAAFLIDLLIPCGVGDGFLYVAALFGMLWARPPRAALQLAVPLSMALHELATNTAKYGALSRLSGQVRVSWNVTEPEGQLLLEWRESGGPPAEAPRAEARGFGSRLIEQVARELGASLEQEWHVGA